MFAKPDGSAERPIPCRGFFIDEAHMGGSGCGLFLFVGFALSFLGMGALGLLSDHQVEKRTRVVQARVVDPPTLPFEHPDGTVRTLYPEGRRWVEIPNDDGSLRRVAVPGKQALTPNTTLAVRIGRRGDVRLEDDHRADQWSNAAPIAIGTLMLFYALLIMRRWGLESARRKRLRSLNRIVPALTWRFRHYQKGRGRFNRWRVVVTFVAPDGRYFEAESEEFNLDPEPRMAAHQPQVLLDTERPELSAVSMSSLPSTA